MKIKITILLLTLVCGNAFAQIEEEPMTLEKACNDLFYEKENTPRFSDPDRDGLYRLKNQKNNPR